MYHESFNKIDTCSLRAKGSLHHVVSIEEGRCLSIFDFASGAPVGSFNTLLLFSTFFCHRNYPLPNDKGSKSLHVLWQGYS